MAVLGFSHISSEVKDMDKSIQFYLDNSFQLKFVLEMDVPQAKQRIVKGEASKVRLAYLIYKTDETCNIELLEHNTKEKFESKDKIQLLLFS